MDHLRYLCLVFVMLLRLFIAALWSPAGIWLTSWLLFVMFMLLSYVVSWVTCGTWLYCFLNFAIFLTLILFFRHFNEMTKQHDLSGGSSSSNQGQGPSGSSGQGHIRPRTVSSPIPYVSPNSSRPLSPGKDILEYSKTCVKWPLSKRAKIGFQDQLSLNAGQKYCRML